MKMSPLPAALVMMSPLLGGCFLVEDMGGVVVVRNETDVDLQVEASVVSANDETLVPYKDCGSGELRAYDLSGNLVAEYVGEWCPNDTWTITPVSSNFLRSDP